MSTGFTKSKVEILYLHLIGIFNIDNLRGMVFINISEKVVPIFDPENHKFNIA